MARLNPPTREDMNNDDERAAFDHIVASRGQVSGPFTVLVRSPEVGRRVADVGAYCRFESEIPKPLITLAVLNVSRHFNCRFEWAGWTGQARAAGIREDIIQAIAERRRPEGMSEDEELVYSFGEQLLSPAHRLSQETYDAAVARFGLKGTVDLAVTYGYFSLLSFVLNGFEVDVPEGHDVQPD